MPIALLTNAATAQIGMVTTLPKPLPPPFQPLPFQPPQPQPLSPILPVQSLPSGQHGGTPIQVKSLITLQSQNTSVPVKPLPDRPPDFVKIADGYAKRAKKRNYRCAFKRNTGSVYYGQGAAEAG